MNNQKENNKNLVNISSTPQNNFIHNQLFQENNTTSISSNFNKNINNHYNKDSNNVHI